jgi:hypothetical protein
MTSLYLAKDLEIGPDTIPHGLESSHIADAKKTSPFFHNTLSIAMT